MLYEEAPCGVWLCKGLLRAVALATAQRERADGYTPVPAYRDERVSQRVVNLIQSYTGVVMRDVYRVGEGGNE